MALQRDEHGPSAEAEQRRGPGAELADVVSHAVGERAGPELPDEVAKVVVGSQVAHLVQQAEHHHLDAEDPGVRRWGRRRGRGRGEDRGQGRGGRRLLVAQDQAPAAPRRPGEGDPALGAHEERDAHLAQTVAVGRGGQEVGQHRPAAVALRLRVGAAAQQVPEEPGFPDGAVERRDALPPFGVDPRTAVQHHLGELHGVLLAVAAAEGGRGEVGVVAVDRQPGVRAVLQQQPQRLAAAAGRQRQQGRLAQGVGAVGVGARPEQDPHDARHGREPDPVGTLADPQREVQRRPADPVAVAQEAQHVRVGAVLEKAADDRDLLLLRMRLAAVGVGGEVQGVVLQPGAAAAVVLL